MCIRDSIIAPPYEAIPAKAPAPNDVTPALTTSVAFKEATSIFLKFPVLSICNLSFSFKLTLPLISTFLNFLKYSTNCPMSFDQAFNLVVPKTSKSFDVTALCSSNPSLALSYFLCASSMYSFALLLFDIACPPLKRPAAPATAAPAARCV